MASGSNGGMSPEVEGNPVSLSVQISTAAFGRASGAARGAVSYGDDHPLPLVDWKRRQVRGATRDI